MSSQSSLVVSWQRIYNSLTVATAHKFFFAHARSSFHRLIYDFRLAINSESESYITRLSVGQSVLEWSTHLGLTTSSLLLSDSCGFVDVGRSLWWEDGPVVYNWYWPSPAQLFSGPNPMRISNIFYCLKFETSFSSPPTTRRATVKVFDPASIRETASSWLLIQSQSQSYIATDGQSVSQSWCRAQSGSHDQIFIIVWELWSCYCGEPSLTRGRVCLLSESLSQ
jgi:hypothetical protein